MRQSKLSSVMSVDLYEGVEKILDIRKQCFQEINQINWNELVEYLRTLSKDSIDETPVRWMIHQSTEKLGECSYEDNFNEFEKMVPDIPKEVGHWLHLNFKVGEDIGITRNNFIADKFKTLINSTKDLPGLLHVGINHITPFFWTPKHTDGYPGFITILITFNVSKYNPEKMTLEVGSELFNFKDRNFFVFDPEYPHQAINSSDDSWVFVTLRISQDFFKISSE